MFCQICLDILELGMGHFVKVADPVQGHRYCCWHHLSTTTFQDSIKQGCQICTALWHDVSVTAKTSSVIETLPSSARTRLIVNPISRLSHNSLELRASDTPEPLCHLSFETTLDNDLLSTEFYDGLGWIYFEVHEQSCMNISVT